MYLSHKLCPTERKYAAIEWEALTMCWAVEQLKSYLWGQCFTIVTHHAPLE